MPAAAVLTPRSHVHLDGLTLRIHAPVQQDEAPAARPDPAGATPEEITRIPLADLERLTLGDQAAITLPALSACLQHSIPVGILSWQGKWLGSFEPPGPAHASCRLLQYQRAADPVHALAVSRALVCAKITNSHRLIQRLNATRALHQPAHLRVLLSLRASAAAAPDLPTLRGCEGAAAAAHYRLWAAWLPQEFPFLRRSTRPPADPPNAVLSWLYTLLTGELLSQCRIRGLDPLFGALHPHQDGRWALPLDLIEPFRPAIADSLALRFFSLRILRQEHFEPRDGGIFLTRPGIRLVHQHYEEKMTRSFLSRQLGIRISPRQLLARAATDWKNALSAPGDYAPFLLN